MEARYVLVVFVVCTCGLSVGKDISVTSASTSLVRDHGDSHLLLFSLLDGSLIGVDQRTGSVRWRVKDEPVVKVPLDTSKAVSPIFLPDPKDGSLYVLSNTDQEALKKLPFTIPQLVASSPCRSADGILYTGKKMDTWFSVDIKTGEKLPVLSFDDQEHVCPLASAGSDTIYIGRTEYSVVMLDSKRRERKWNITFVDYSADSMDEDLLTSYGMLHFMGSSSGRVFTVDHRTYKHLWSRDYHSPVIGVYVLGSNGLISCPFTSVAETTLDVLADQLTWLGTDEMKLQSTLYVGEHPYGLYALPSLVDKSVATVDRFNLGPLLLEGPEQTVAEAKKPAKHDGGLSEISLTELDSIASLEGAVSAPYPVIILGYYQLPEYSKTSLLAGQKLHSSVTLPSLPYSLNRDLENETEEHESLSILQNGQKNAFTQTSSDLTSESRLCWEQLTSGNVSALLYRECLHGIYSDAKLWIMQQENKSIKVVMAFIIISMAALFCYVRGQMREFHQMSNSSRVSNRGSESEVGVTVQTVKTSDGALQVGKITLYSNDVLGKGCEGTFVYRGLFDGRSVAVKRLLPECFSLADREVALLRESDQHAHVIRYFCTEQDSLFRYIALELAAATLADLVEGRLPSIRETLPPNLTTTEILRQATMGLAHLHSLDIVHRDIKPQNVLLSMPSVHGEVRAMISDFGLCKKLQKGRMSFSRRSGVAGTDGWIAPEMLSGFGRNTCAVDIFSMGCVFFYVKTNGKHPFGDPLRRQANILCGESKLTDVHGAGTPAEELLLKALIERMLSWEPLERPPAQAVLSHPIFWNESKVMAFFQDVSDRVEKDEAKTSAVLQALEMDSVRVVRGDWRLHICDEVAQDLRRYRNYRGHSVRDLLRALRNKKHHYRELSAEAQESLGAIPEEFVLYWMKRFPRLLLHSWLAMQSIRQEPVFKPYYHTSHTFASTEVEIDADHDWESIISAETLDINTPNWQILKDQDSPKNQKKHSRAANGPHTNWREKQGGESIVEKVSMPVRGQKERFSVKHESFKTPQPVDRVHWRAHQKEVQQSGDRIPERDRE